MLERTPGKAYSAKVRLAERSRKTLSIDKFVNIIGSMRYLSFEVRDREGENSDNGC